MQKAKSKLPVLLWGFTFLLIAASIGAAFSITGGPHHQRLIKFDQKRVSDLQRLKSDIQQTFRKTGALPDTLASLPQARFREMDFRRDPETNRPYRYRKINDQTFALCATFNLDNRQSDDANDSGYYGAPRDYFRHAAGNNCFRFHKIIKGSPARPFASFEPEY